MGAKTRKKEARAEARDTKAHERQAREAALARAPPPVEAAVPPPEPDTLPLERPGPADQPGGEPKVLRFLPLVNEAVSHFTKRLNESMATKFVVHRVSRYPEFPGATVRLMVEQAANRGEALAFAQQQPKLAKLILWGRYIPVGETQVRKSEALAPDLVIEPGVGLTEQQFRDWFESTQTCKKRCCEIKMILDLVLARGDKVLLDAGMTSNLAEPSYLTKVERASLTAELPINAFQLVDPGLQPEWAHRSNEAAFPIYYQGIQGQGDLQHDILLLTLRPVRGGAEFKIYADPTYRQVTPTWQITHTLKCYPMGPGVDPEYAADGRPPEMMLWRDDAPFVDTNIGEIMSRIYPQGNGLYWFGSDAERKAHINEEAMTILLASGEILAKAYECTLPAGGVSADRSSKAAAA